MDYLKVVIDKCVNTRFDNVTLDIQRIYSYFLTMTFGPISFTRAWSFLNQRKPAGWPIVNSKIKIGLYFLTRILPALNCFHFTYNIITGFMSRGSQEKDEDSLGVMEAVLWVSAWFSIFLFDYFMLSPHFTLHFYRMLELCEQIWTKLETRLETLTMDALRIQKERKIRSLMAYSSVLDAATIYTYEWETVSLLFLFTALPWSSSFAGSLHWLFLRLNDVCMDLGWGGLLIFPGLVAHNLAYVVKGMEEGLKVKMSGSGLGGNLYSEEDIMKDFQILEYAVRELRNNRFSMVLLLLYGSIGMSQTFQCYVAFQTIGTNASNYFFILDLYLTGSRVLAGYSALSRVAHASDSFLRTAKRCIIASRREQGNEDSSLGVHQRSLCRKMRHLKNIRPIKMTIGPCSCNANLPLAAMAVYLNYIVAAALWQ